MSSGSDALWRLTIVEPDQSRRCPLCSQGIGDYLIHHIRSKYDFQKHYLTPLRTSPKPQPLSAAAGGSRGRNSGSRREVQWGRSNRRERQRERDTADALERAIDKRRWVYRHGLYAKVITALTFLFAFPVKFIIANDLNTARCFQFLHALPSFSDSFTICSQSGPHNPRHHLHSEGTLGMGLSRCRGKRIPQPHAQETFRLFVLNSMYTTTDTDLSLIVSHNLHYLSFEIVGHPL